MHQPHHLTALEAAARLGTVRRRIADGSLPSVCIGRAVRNPAASLDLPVARPARCGHREAVAPDASDRDDSQVALLDHWNASPWRRAFDRDARLHADEPLRLLLEVVAARGSATARGGRAARNPGGALADVPPS